MVSEPLLNLYANAKISGTILNMGHSKIQIDSILEGQVIPYATKSQNFAGKHLTELLS